MFGFGFPFFRGGPLRYLDDVGAAKAVKILEDLAREYGERFTPASRLKRMAEARELFYPPA